MRAALAALVPAPHEPAAVVAGKEANTHLDGLEMAAAALGGIQGTVVAAKAVKAV